MTRLKQLILLLIIFSWPSISGILGKKLADLIWLYWYVLMNLNEETKLGFNIYSLVIFQKYFSKAKFFSN